MAVLSQDWLNLFSNRSSFKKIVRTHRSQLIDRTMSQRLETKRQLIETRIIKGRRKRQARNL